MRKSKVLYLIAVFILSLSLVLSLSAQEKKEGEELYTIKKGDTLWDISAKFLNDPFLWPKLWQRNPYITNPHWIYPGQPIRISPEEMRKVVEEKPKEIKEEAPPVEKKPEVAEVKPVEEKPPVFPERQSAGFISDAAYRGIGMVLDARDGKTLLGEGDIVYLAFRTSEPIQIGDRYTVFSPASDVRHPVTRKKIAKKYLVKGNVQVIDQHGNFYTAKITESFDAILRGDLIQPYLSDRIETGK
jgi:LysM repeat protein